MSEKQSKEYSEELLQKALGWGKTTKVGKKFKHEFTLGDLVRYSVASPEHLTINFDTHKETISISFDKKIGGSVIAKDLRILADIFEGKMTLKKTGFPIRSGMTKEQANE